MLTMWTVTCFIATILVIGYLLFIPVADLIVKVFRKLFIKEKPVYVPPTVYKVDSLMQNYTGYFRSFEEAFEKGCELYIKRALEFPDRANDFIAIEKNDSYTDKINYEDGVLYANEIFGCGLLTKQLTPEQIAVCNKD